MCSVWKRYLGSPVSPAQGGGETPRLLCAARTSAVQVPIKCEVGNNGFTKHSFYSQLKNDTSAVCIKCRGNYPEKKDTSAGVSQRFWANDFK